MNEREQATALRLLARWRTLMGADPTSKAFEPTYIALRNETDDFLGTDNDPVRTAPVRTCGNCGRVEPTDVGPRCSRCGHVAATPSSVK